MRCLSVLDSQYATPSGSQYRCGVAIPVWPLAAAAPGAIALRASAIAALVTPYFVPLCPSVRPSFGQPAMPNRASKEWLKTGHPKMTVVCKHVFDPQSAHNNKRDAIHNSRLFPIATAVGVPGGTPIFAGGCNKQILRLQSLAKQINVAQRGVAPPHCHIRAARTSLS